MALIVHPAGTQVSGSTGGTTYSHNRFGAYTRNRSVPVNPNTDRQIGVRNAVRALTIAWQNTLTDAQRNGWEVYAANVSWINKLGQTVHLTGLNHYIRSNTPRLQVGVARVDAPPTTYNLATAELGLAAVASEVTQIASMTYDDTAAWANEAGGFQFVSCGLPKNGATKFFGGPYRIFGTITGDDIAPPSSPFAVTWTFPFAEGNRLWLRTRIARADGRLSEFAQVNFLGAA